jgi:hypothetical protein
MTRAQLSVLQLGEPEDVAPPARPGIDREAAEPPRARRGLVIKEVTLRRDFEGWFDDDNEIYFVSTAMDFSGQEPVIFPIGDAESATMKLEPGDTFRFTLGEGAPVFPEREIVSGLAVQVHVFESDSGARGAGDAIDKAADAVKTDGNLVKVLEKLIKDPGGLAVDVVLGAAAEVAKVVSAVLKSNDNDNVAFFTGYWSAEGSWDGKLAAEQPGASIRFGELPTP